MQRMAPARCRNFYNACQGPAWELVLREAGHFQLLDEQSLLQRAVCAVGPVDDAAVRNVAQVHRPLQVPCSGLRDQTRLVQCTDVFDMNAGTVAWAQAPRCGMQAVMVAWGELMVKDRPYSMARGAMQTVSSDGGLVAGTAHATALQREALLAMQASLRDLMPHRGEPSLAMRLKNI